MNPDRVTRLALLRRAAACELPAPSGFAGFSCYQALHALELELHGEAAPSFPWEWVEHSLAMLYTRTDCQDFAMAALVRMLYRYPDSRLLTADRRQQITAACLQAKYHPLDPGADHCVWFTENHQALYVSAEYLLGQMFPEATFSNTGKLGAWHRERGRERLYQWLDHRTRFGFCEWNALGYYSMDFVPLLNIIEFAEDPILRHKANVVLDLLLFHVAANTWRGLSGGSQGRAYEDQIKGAQDVEMVRLGRVLWWDGEAPPSDRTICFLCASDVTFRGIFRGIARDLDRPAILRERHSLHPDDGPAYGVHPDRQRDIWFWGAAGMIEHPKVADTHFAWFSGVPRNDKYWSARNYYRRHIAAGTPYDGEAMGYAMSTANVYTYRHPAYQLSTTQSYRPGCPGNIQHIWSACIGLGANIYGTNPVDEDGTPTGRPGLWQGNAVLPHAVQHKNVILALYRIRPMQIRDWDKPNSVAKRVHIWIPREHCDEIREQDGRLYLRCDTTYLALIANLPGAWREDNEWNINGTDIALVIEAGCEADNGNFEAFVAACDQATLVGDIDTIRFQSPSCGAIQTGWKKPLLVNGEQIPIDAYPRFDTPWCQTEFGATRFHIASADQELTLNAEPDV